MNGAAFRVAVAAPHGDATAAAGAAIAAGGNAFDAALAAAAALTVVYPHQCAVGGDLIAVLRTPEGTTTAVVSAGAAAAEIDPGAIATSHGRMPGRGPLAVTVPGVVAGWQAIAAAGAAFALSRPLEAAARIAADGCEVSPGLARALAANSGVLVRDAGMRSLFFDEAGNPLSAGATIHQPALAVTLQRLAQDPTDIYSGGTAALLVEGLRELGSPLSTADLAAHAAQLAEPVSRTVNGTTWSVAPPPSQGVALLAVLGDGSPRTAGQTLARCLRTAAYRDTHLADPRVSEVDIEAFLASAAAPSMAVPTGPGTPRPAGDTVAVTAVDTEGRAVSIVQSVFQSFGAGILEPRTGIVLHSRGSAFSLEPGHPARLAPGARPPHTLSPVLAESPDALVALGCQGGRAQPWILAQVAEDLADPATEDLAAVLGRPRWVFGAADIGAPSPTLVTEENELTADLLEVAAAAGFAGQARGTSWDEAGHVQAARLRGDRLDAATDPRADGRVHIGTGTR